MELLDAMPQAELARLHQACDAVLVPLPPNDRNLVQGCCPLKLLEAMASGTPVVASDLPVVRAVAEHGTEVWLVRPGSPKAIAEGVRTLRADPALRLRLSQGGRARIERDFTWARACESLVGAYEEAFGRRRDSTRWSASASEPA